MMLTKKVLLSSAVFILLAFAFLFLGNYYDLFASAPLDVTPHFQFVHGCTPENERCSSSVYELGELGMASSQLSFDKTRIQCITNKKYTTPSEVPKECFSVNFTFDGKKYTLNNGESTQLNPYIKVAFEAKGTIIKGEVCHTVCTGESDTRVCNKICKNLDYEYDWLYPDWTNAYTFEVIEPFLQSSIEDYAYGKITEDIMVDYAVKNKLTTLDGGSVIRQQSGLFSPAKEEREELFKIKEGENKYTTNANTKYLGDVDSRITPFVIVYNSIYDFKTPYRIYDNELFITTRTLPNIANGSETIDNATEAQQHEKENNYFMLYIAIAFIALGGGIYFFSRE